MNNIYNNSYLNVMFWNSRSVCRRKEEFEKIIRDFDIIICVETWLSPDNEDDINKFIFPGFITLRKDRLTSTGGGIAFLIRKNIAFFEIQNLIFPNQLLELCGITITNLKESFNIIACYRPPHISLSQNEWDILTNNIKSNSKTLFVGDFNAHNQAWNCQRNNTDGSRFYNSLIDSNLFLHNSNSLTHIDVRTKTKSNYMKRKVLRSKPYIQIGIIFLIH